MSKTGLTRVERRTILSKSFFYVILTVIVSDQMVNGPFWFKFIPWLYIIGLFGKSFFSKPFLTIVIVAFTTFTLVMLKNFGITNEVIVITINSILMVTLGIVSGYLLNKLVLAKRKVFKTTFVKNTLIFLWIIIITIIVLFINSYINSNICSYKTSRENLKKHIKSTYQEQGYKIKDVNYKVINFRGEYFYTIEIKGQCIKLEEKNNKTFNDINYEERIETINKKFKEDLNFYLKGKLTEVFYIKPTDIEAELKYTTINIFPDKVILNITVKTNMTNPEPIYEAYIQTIQIIKEYPGILNYEVEYNLMLNNQIARIKEEQLNDLNIVFLKNIFEIEKIS